MIALLLGLAGCSAEVADPVAETHSELMTDPSGTITVFVTGALVTNSVTLGASGGDVYMGPDYVLVGGGGGVVGEPVPGVLLQDTSPHSDGNGPFWRLRVTPHVHPSAFTAASKAIGLKLSGVTAGALRGLVTITQATGAAGRFSQATAVPPAGHIVLGGGATAPTTGNQQLLVASMPHFPRFTTSTHPDGWTAVSMDHEQAATGSAIAYVISIPRCPPGFAGGCLQSTAISTVSSVGGGYRPITIAGNGALTGVGGDTRFSGGGRFVTTINPQEDLSTPNNFTVQVDSKDHDIADSGDTIGWAIVLNTASP